MTGAMRLRLFHRMRYPATRQAPVTHCPFTHRALVDLHRARTAPDRVLLVSDSEAPLDTHSLYHLGLGVADKPPRTTWRGAPLHELWLRDPSGYGIEVYARLTAEELAAMPAGQEPVYTVAGPAPGTEPATASGAPSTP